MLRLSSFFALILLLTIAQPGCNKGSAPNVWEQKIAQLSPADRLALDTLFRFFLEESEAGYVLLGVKPLCSEGLYAKPYSLGEMKAQYYVQSQLIWRGLRIWQELGLQSLSKRFALVVNKVPDPYGQWYGVTFLDRPAVLKVVADNLPLFRYVLGPTVTPEFVLERLEDPNVAFDDACGNSRVLIGILMGFGTDNCLICSRSEDIAESEMGYRPETLPFKPSRIRPMEELGMFDSSVKYVDSPSAGYSSLEQELEDLEQKVCISRIVVNKKIPVFACLESDTSAIERYTKIYPAVQALIADETDPTTKILNLMVP
ncbi:MAG: hypothetical protein JSR80_05310 [Verrucomicrobia bacterium]|nr:hypothetical protein [Verrucomicrobiota bacterium]